MLSAENNIRLTRVGPDQPMGVTLRRYWTPALLASELPEPDGPPVRVKLLGEDLVAFRDSRGEVGLLEAYCPHRRAPLFFGRNEEAGLRCVYHGWKFDTSGNCLDLPSEPPDSPLKARIGIRAYPTWEKGGLIWAYMGPRGQLPPYPDYEWLRAPDTHFKISKTYEACNWLQTLEGGIDTSHSSFAHNNDLGDTSLLRSRDTHPILDVDVTDYGFCYYGVRNISETEKYVRAYQYIMPFMQLRGGFISHNGRRYDTPVVNGHLWVPMDDTSTCVYNFAYSVDPKAPLTPEEWERKESRAGRGAEDFIPGSYWLIRNPSNDYLIDREVQRTKTFTGIQGVNTQDFALQEGMGPICDRTLEHLGTSDKAILQARRLLLAATDLAAEDRDPLALDPESYRNVRAADEIIPSDEPWRDAMQSLLVATWN